MAKVEPRFKKRVPCRLTRSESSFTGVVLDLSRRGLFVQTAASARPGDEVEVVLHGNEPGRDVVLNAQVVWQRKVPFQLRSSLQSGMGLQIRYASESYYSLLADAAGGSSPGR
jgi:Tfp pilus assembly protein PilZ